MIVDPFAHHPELRDLIKDPAQSSFRELKTANVVARMKELGQTADWLYTDDQREAMRRSFLAARPELAIAGLWVFAYGSLMWDPAVHFSRVLRAHMPNYARRFILRDVNGGRGTAEAPGLMAALDHGEEGCDGLAFLIAAADVEGETQVLWQREMIGRGYTPIMAPARTEAGVVQCLTFCADYSAASMVPEITRAEQVRFFATGSGFLGTSLDYLRGIARQSAALGIVDDSVNSLLAEAEAMAAG